MKKTDTTPPSAPAAAAPAPVLDLNNAKAVTPYRHAKTARTVGWHQPAGELGVHLFSPTCGFIATVPPADLPASVVPPADSPASSESPAS